MACHQCGWKAALDNMCAALMGFAVQHDALFSLLVAPVAVAYFSHALLSAIVCGVLLPSCTGARLRRLDPSSKHDYFRVWTDTPEYFAWRNVARVLTCFMHNTPVTDSRVLSTLRVDALCAKTDSRMRACRTALTESRYL